MAEAYNVRALFEVATIPPPRPQCHKANGTEGSARAPTICVVVVITYLYIFCCMPFAVWGVRLLVWRTKQLAHGAEGGIIDALAVPGECVLIFVFFYFGGRNKEDT